MNNFVLGDKTFSDKKLQLNNIYFYNLVSMSKINQVSSKARIG